MVGGAPRYKITDEEYVQASRAVRTATWGAVSYLITTDILWPFSTPQVSSLIFETYIRLILN